MAPARTTAQATLVVPVHRVMDSRAGRDFEPLSQFWWSIWPEAVHEFDSGGIRLRTSDAAGEIRLSPGQRPVFVGVRRGVINLVLTDHIPMDWDKGRALAGVTTLDDGYHLCVIALNYAHGNRIPFLSVNTCVHELCHALLQDVFLDRPPWYRADEREFRIDWYATRLWLFHDARAIRESARVYLERLGAASAHP
jgi:hypothetical protein